MGDSPGVLSRWHDTGFGQRTSRSSSGMCRHASFAKSLVGHTNWVRGLAISPDGTMIASASHDKTAKLWDLQSGEFSGR